VSYKNTTRKTKATRTPLKTEGITLYVKKNKFMPIEIDIWSARLPSNRFQSIHHYMYLFLNKY